eukprot:scaffold339_cov77-Cyclotella_meneghiniana.AAC.4
MLLSSWWEFGNGNSDFAIPKERSINQNQNPTQSRYDLRSQHQHPASSPITSHPTASLHFSMNLYHKLAQPTYDISFVLLLLLFETVLTSLIVYRIPYTEIDWIAYMQEVSSYQNGERDYINIRGDTGPLVYPAGFLYLYSWLKGWASDDENADDGLDGSTAPDAIHRIHFTTHTTTTSKAKITNENKHIGLDLAHCHEYNVFIQTITFHIRPEIVQRCTSNAIVAYLYVSLCFL